MEEKILELLKEIRNEITDLKVKMVQDKSELLQEIKAVSEKVDICNDKIDVLAERINTCEFENYDNWKDIKYLKSVIFKSKSK